MSNRKDITISFSDTISFTVSITGKGGTIMSTGLESTCYMEERDVEEMCQECACFEAIVGTLCSTILAHACAGIDVASDAYKKGLESALSDLDRYSDCQH